MGCIDSILEKTSGEISYQIIVIDNASEKEDFNALEHYITSLKNPDVFLFRSVINTGFGGGNMLGVQFADAGYYAFVNNDTLLKDDCLLACCEFMQSHPEAAVCGPQIYKNDTEKDISFDHFLSLEKALFGNGYLEKMYRKSKPNRKKAYTQPVKVDYVNGSFMFFRAGDFNEVGGFDTNIFLFYEESDICYRLKKKQRYTYFLPQASYIHYEGKSQKSDIGKKTELKRSMLYVMRKNNGYFSYRLLYYFLLVRYFLTSLIKPGYFPLAKSLFTGLPLSKSVKLQQKIRK